MSNRDYLKSRILENQNTGPSLPPVSTQIKNVGQSVINNIKQVMAGGNLRCESEETIRRLSICKACPLYIADKSRCSICGCYLKVKVTLQAERCPNGLW